ncbi:MAG: penicillin acylase family protein [Nevskiales bacterium]
MRRIPICAVLLLLLAAGCKGGSNSNRARYDVEVTRTQMGIPHIKAANFGSAGYGYGYAFADDNLCVLMEDLVTIRGERARYLGRDGSYTIVPNGVTADNVTSDFFWKFLASDAAWQHLRDAADPELRAVSEGFVAGFNRYIRELKSGGHAGRHAACRDAAFLQPISEADMYRRYFRLALIASSSVFVNEIANAAPPSGLPVAQASTARRSAALRRDPGPIKALIPQERAFGSNMYALGPEATSNGVPMVFGNPHFPWSGTERLYISHLTIPGKVDIMGSSLYGVPAVLIGFNRNVAWSHTVSTAYRFTLYELTLNPANPTQYLYEGEMRDMEATPVTVRILQSDGTLGEETRTLYRSHYGPMMVLEASGVPILGWNNLKAYSLRDANAENDRLINQFARWNQAKSLDEFIGLHKSVLGIPWVNTVASGPGGKAYYGDVSVVPHVTDEKVQLCAAQPLATVIGQLVPGLPLLDGSRAACEWGMDADAPVAGIFGPGNLPTLLRDDYVHNCNDSYWLTNPDAPITGYDRIIGDENAERSLRTRLCILNVERRLSGTDGRPGNTFNMDTLQETVLGSHIYSAELARDAVVNNLCQLPMLLGSSGPVDVAQACNVLRSWDLSDNLNSTGGHIWRELWANLSGNPLGLPLFPSLPVSLIWLTQFSAGDAVNTPSGLNFLNPLVSVAFADAVAAVNASGIPLDRPLGEIQRSGVHEERIPVFGGEHSEGAFTVVSTNALDTEGYRVTYGNSYIQTVTWGSDGNPVAEGFITYSQSTDPANPHFSDFTKAYSQKAWQPFPFTPAQIAAQKISVLNLRQ